MTIRSELEAPLVSYGLANNIKVSLEGIAFDATKTTEYLKITFSDRTIINPTVEFVRKRTRGFVQIDVYCPDGKGSKRVEELAEAVAALYPPYNKQLFPTVSIEGYPQISKARSADTNFRVISVTIWYRQES
jgi:hypothetical protein